MSNLFTEEKYNALYQALEECAESINEKETPLVIRIVDKLEELGYIMEF